MLQAQQRPNPAGYLFYYLYQCSHVELDNRFGFPSGPNPPRPTDDNSRPIFDQKIELCTIKGNQTEGSAGGGASPAVPDSDASLVLALNDMF
jgi:hypothetical protein